MKCWIASFPRSGNTFFRNILYYVYGLESSTWHLESDYPVDENYAEFPFIKTHLLPEQLNPSDPDIPAIYLVRDGRDAMVSIAHHRSDIVLPGSDFLTNLQEAIIAAEGSFFGGWSENVKKWGERANLIIKYEDLVKDPKKQLERVEQLIPMPKANWENLPDFQSMKFGKPKYGGQTTSKSIKVSPKEFSQKFFRKGKAGSWKEDMPVEMLDLFWRKHGEQMDRFGYIENYSQVGQNEILDGKLMRSLGLIDQDSHEKKKYRILIEGNKLQISRNDGIKRYLIQLLKGFDDVSRLGGDEFHFDLLINRRIVPLRDYLKHIRSEVEDVKFYERALLGFKSLIKNTLPTLVYEPIAEIYRKSSVRTILRNTKSKVVRKEELQLVKNFENPNQPFDLIHLPLPQNFHFIEKLKGKLVVTIHDLTHKIKPEFHTPENIKLTESGIQYCIDNASHFIAVSNNSCEDFARNYQINPFQISGIYESADPDLFFQNFNPKLSIEVREKYRIFSSPYFLSLSTIEPRKNLINTIKGFEQFKKLHPESDLKLVISGDKGWMTEPILKAIQALSGNVHFTGFVEDRDLHVLYSEALAFLYLSYYEGFGLPPLEAMFCRTAVLHSNRSSLKEVVGESGIIADPDSPEDIAKKMEKIYFDTQYRKLMAEKGFKKAMEFSSRKTILETLIAYKKCLK